MEEDSYGADFNCLHALGFISGYQFVGNRVALVQRPGILYRILHLGLGLAVGYVIGAFTLIKLIFGALFMISK